MRKYRHAKDAEQKYINAAHAQRLREFAALKREAKSRAEALGYCVLYCTYIYLRIPVDCRIAVAPLNVDDYFCFDRNEDKLVLADDLEAFHRSLEMDEKSRMTDATQGLSFGLQESSWKTNSIFKTSNLEKRKK